MTATVTPIPGLKASPAAQVPRAPKHLAAATKRWFRSVVEGFELDDHHVRLLTLAAESWDRAVQAREILDREGLSYLDRFGSPRARPEIAVERDSRTAFCRILRELDLDASAPAEPSRPPGLKSNRG